MTGQSVRTFPHRKNPDGTWDSICSDCFRTIARVKDPSDLELFERDHDCAQFKSLSFRFRLLSESDTDVA
jgi:hypothetical protein